jgi:hypothetical protein
MCERSVNAHAEIDQRTRRRHDERHRNGKAGGADGPSQRSGAVPGINPTPETAFPAATTTTGADLMREITDADVSALAAKLLELVPPPPPPARHSPCFSSASWFGQNYCFTASQARVVAALWAAWQTGFPELSGHHLLRQCGGKGPQRLATLFQNNPAWGTMIVPGAIPGCWRLQVPAEPPPPEPQTIPANAVASILSEFLHKITARTHPADSGAVQHSEQSEPEPTDQEPHHAEEDRQAPAGVADLNSHPRESTFRLPLP